MDDYKVKKNYIFLMLQGTDINREQKQQYW